MQHNAQRGIFDERKIKFYSIVKIYRSQGMYFFLWKFKRYLLVKIL